MSSKHSPIHQRPTGSPGIGHNGPPSEINDPAFWYELIGEKIAGDFIGVVTRTMQLMRQRGGGPKYVFISARCLRYRRIDLKAWAEARMRSSTSDPGKAAA